MKRVIALFLFLCALIVPFYAVLPLLQQAYIPTHDGEYHIIRFIEFHRMLSSGYWFPKWAPTMNSGYGIPIFLFHYPFPNYIGSLFQALGANAVSAFQYALASGYLVAYISAFIWLRKLFGMKPALVGVIVAGCIPYWFVDMYVRGSVGEVWALAWVFILLGLLEYKRFFLASFAVAGLILSHNILAMLFLPFLFVVFFLRDKKMIPSIFLGMGLAAYFWIPALWERQFVTGLNTVNIRDHFVALYELIIPSWGTEFSGNMFGGNKISFQIGIIPMLVLCISLILFIRLRKKERIFPLALYSFLIVFGALVCMLPWSAFLWHTISPLQFIQYPWRLLSFLIPCIALLTAYSASKISKPLWYLLISIAAFSLAFPYMSPVRYAPRDTWYYLSRPNFTDGTSSMGNSFSTIWTGWKKTRPTYLIEIINGKVSGGITTNTFLTKAFTVYSQHGSDVQLSLLYFPGWEVLVDGVPTSIDYTTDGTIRFFVEPGNHAVLIRFSDTPVRRVANVLSHITLVWLCGWGILGIYERRHTHVSRFKRS